MAAGSGVTGSELLTLLDEYEDGQRSYAKRRKTVAAWKFCPHCKELVNAKTFWRHKKLHYNEVGKDTFYCA